MRTTEHRRTGRRGTPGPLRAVSALLLALVLANPATALAEPLPGNEKPSSAPTSSAAPSSAAPGGATPSGAVPSADVAAERLELSSGHVDLVAVFLEGGDLVVAGKADVDRVATRFDPATTTLTVTDAAKRAAPTSPAYGFLGVPGGSPIHVIPQTFQPDVLWAGWNTESVPRGALAGDALDLALDSATGPGRVEVYLSGADGPERVFSSHDDLPPQRVAVPTHAHANWAFTAPGEYELRFQATATAASGEPLTSGPVTYHLVVGGGDTTPPTTTTTEPPTRPTTPTTTRPTTTQPAPQQQPQAQPRQQPQAQQTQAPQQPQADRCVPTAVTRTVEPGQVEVVTDGHFDYGPVVEGSGLAARVKDDRQGEPVHRDPASYVFHLDDTARTTPPSGSGYDFLGGGPVWMIPLTQRSGIPWLGWNTQHPSVTSGITGDITMTLENVEGPGKLAVYGQDPFGGVGDRYFGTAEGFPRSTKVPVGRSGVHVHGAWAFTAPGSYAVTFTFSGALNGAQATARSTLAFHVGPGDPATARPSAQVVEQVGRTASGAECEIDPQTLASTGLDGSAVAGLAVAAALLIPLGFLLTSLTTLATARARRR
ncbi:MULTISPECIES: TIGR03773 family transporter-associated surface protein [Actinosynnema]|uniref:TIGR03773 family transporter-associated surface protein n=1 Tax=Actinosynnema TaxID=40566 RepID=UPI0020A447D1|nr:TIGR03773 family transporter-associated surface protein [Actinosynnema pretiosum]MCP2096597.1 putative ABC transporter-associated repeat protein [Actinosynnema pretiosum]